MIALHVLAAVLGVGLILSALASAINTFVVPRGLPSRTLTRLAFFVMYFVFTVPFRRASRSQRERALAFYGPVTLLTLPVAWLACVLFGYTAIYWALGNYSWSAALTNSRESLLVIGSALPSVPAGGLLAFSETVISLLLAAILVSYLPAIYAAFSSREQAVTGLETQAGSPASPLKMLKRYYMIHGLDDISGVWQEWESWFEMVEESHTALLPLVTYRSPQPQRSWITAAGTVLDTASLVASTLDRPRDPHAELCIRAGYICLRRISVLFGIPFDDDPAPDDPISITRDEYDSVCDELAAIGVPLRRDRDQAWRDFNGWRVNYDSVLIGLAVLVRAPPGFWSSDRVEYPDAFKSPWRAARQAAAAAMRGELVINSKAARVRERVAITNLPTASSGR